MISVKGSLFVLSSPSGGGKSSLSKALLINDERIKLSVSVTTRHPRIGEIENIHYIFKTKDEFENLIREKAFLEYALVHNNYYGTLHFNVNEALSAGFDLLLDIDYQGMWQIKAHMSEVISIFIMPPSLDILAKRLRDRAQDSEAVIQARLKTAAFEIDQAKSYDYVIINDNFEVSLQNIQTIIKKYRVKRDEL